jgi:hypothetical protein
MPSLVHALDLVQRVAEFLRDTGCVGEELLSLGRVGEVRECLAELGVFGLKPFDTLLFAQLVHHLFRGVCLLDDGVDLSH